MSIIIKEVVGKKDLKKWVDFPNKLYKNAPAYAQMRAGIRQMARLTPDNCHPL